MQIIPSGRYSSQIISSTQKQLLLQLLEKVYLISQATEWFYAIFWIILSVSKNAKSRKHMYIPYSYF